RAARGAARFARALARLLDHHAPVLVDEHVVAVAILAGGDEFPVALRLVARDLATRQSMQRDHGGEVLALRGIVRGECGRDCDCGDGEGANDAGHGILHASWRNLSRSASTSQMASREALIACASAGSPSCSRLSTFINSNS